MGRGSSEAPRQNSEQFAANDQVAKAQGGAKETAPMLPCQVWKLKVNVTGAIGPRRPKLDAADVTIEWSDKTYSADPCTVSAPDKASTETMLGHGNYTADCSASSKGWYLEAPKSVRLADGDDKSVDLVLKPAIWIGVALRHHKTGDLIEDVLVTGSLAKIGDVVSTTLKDKPLEIEHDDLRPGDSCNLLGLSHDNLVWEAVGDLTSA